MHRLVMALAGMNLLLGAALGGRGDRAPAAGDSGIVRARAIELVDEAGRVRAQLDVESSGEVVFRLRDAAGEVRVKMGAARDGSGLLLLDGATEPGVHLLAKNSGVSLTLGNTRRRRRVITP